MKLMVKSFRFSKAMVVRVNTTFFPEFPPLGLPGSGKPSISLLVSFDLAL